MRDLVVILIQAIAVVIVCIGGLSLLAVITARIFGA